MGSKQRDRVDYFVHVEPAPPLRLTIGFAASSAELVLDRVRSVMKQVAEAQLESWPSDGKWQQQLPIWLTRSFESHTMDQLLADPNLWDFGSWIDAMKHPGWEWWSSGSFGRRGVVECTAHAMPFAIEPLFYLIRVAGAKKTTLEES